MQEGHHRLPKPCSRKLCWRIVVHPDVPRPYSFIAGIVSGYHRISFGVTGCYGNNVALNLYAVTVSIVADGKVGTVARLPQDVYFRDFLLGIVLVHVV